MLSLLRVRLQRPVVCNGLVARARLAVPGDEARGGQLTNGQRARLLDHYPPEHQWQQMSQAQRDGFLAGEEPELDGAVLVESGPAAAAATPAERADGDALRDARAACKAAYPKTHKAVLVNATGPQSALQGGLDWCILQISGDGAQEPDFDEAPNVLRKSYVSHMVVIPLTATCDKGVSRPVVS